MEAPLDPDLEIVDPHHHLWSYPGNDYLAPELTADAADGHRVTTTVFVECLSAYRTSGPEHLRPVGETEFVVSEAERARQAGGPTIAGIIGFADLTHEAVAETLAAHVDAGAGRFRGIRHATAFDADAAIRPSHTNPQPGLMTEPDFGRGIDALGAAGLSFEAWLYHPQLPELARLAADHPDVPIVLDHLGGPLGIGGYADRRDEVLESWRAAMRVVAEHDNVALKLGGIGMPIYGQGFHKSAEPTTSDELVAVWGEPIRWCLDTFGVDRCLFESNFPVDKVSCSALVLWNAFKRMAADAGCTDEEKRALFAGNARRVYRLDVTP